MIARNWRHQVLTHDQKLLYRRQPPARILQAAREPVVPLGLVPAPRSHRPGGLELPRNQYVRALVLGLGAVPAALIGLLHADAALATSHTTSPSEGNIIGAATFSAHGQPVLQLGDRGEAVSRLQQRLIQLGLPAGLSPGVFDASLKASVEVYQTHRGLEADGVVGRDTWTALAGLNVRASSPAAAGNTSVSRTAGRTNSGGAMVPAATWSPSSQPVIQLGASGPAVRHLQERLTTLGYDAGAADGSFGGRTRAAMVEYQVDQTLPISPRVTATMWQRLAQAQPVRASGPTHTPGGTPILDAYVPRSAEARALFREAAIAAGLPAAWADSTGLHRLLAAESQGRVGVPNYTYGRMRSDESRHREVHAELQLGVRSTRSTATGLGQLLLANVDAHYPSGRKGIGEPLEEAIGMLRYIKERYGTPDAAWARYNRNHEGY